MRKVDNKMLLIENIEHDKKQCVYLYIFKTLRQSFSIYTF